METGNSNLSESAKTLLEWLMVAGLFLLVFFSHLLKLAKWGCEEYEDFIRWRNDYKNRQASLIRSGAAPGAAPAYGSTRSESGKAANHRLLVGRPVDTCLRRSSECPSSP